MKTKIFITTILIAIAGLIYAQQKRTTTNSPPAGSSCVVTLTNTEGGCDVVFSMQPRDAASGQATGKRQHSPIRFMVSSSDNSVTEITSPRDPASGQASGKVAGNPIKGISVKGGKNPGGNQFNKIVVTDGSFTLPDDGPDGDYTLIMSWSWGMTQTGTSGQGSGGGAGKARCNVSFTVTKMQGSWDLAVAKK